MTDNEQPRIKRRLRNYLLDPDLQLKYATWVAVFILLVGGVAGLFLWRSQRSLIDEAATAVEARSRAANVSRELSDAVLSKELLARFDDPAFVKLFESEASKIERRYEAEQKEIVTQRGTLMHRQRMAVITLVTVLVGLFLFAVLGTIVLTHRMVGPLFRIRRMVEEIVEGKLAQPSHGLRHSDELKELFDLFAAMVQSLRDREQRHLERTEKILASLERTGAPAEARQELLALQEDLRSRTQ